MVEKPLWIFLQLTDFTFSSVSLSLGKHPFLSSTTLFFCSNYSCHPKSRQHCLVHSPQADGRPLSHKGMRLEEPCGCWLLSSFHFVFYQKMDRILLSLMFLHTKIVHPNYRLHSRGHNRQCTVTSKTMSKSKFFLFSHWACQVFGTAVES